MNSARPGRPSSATIAATASTIAEAAMGSPTCVYSDMNVCIQDRELPRRDVMTVRSSPWNCKPTITPYARSATAPKKATLIATNTKAGQ